MKYLAASIAVVGVVIATAGSSAEETLTLHVRQRNPIAAGAQQIRAVESTVRWQARETAMVVCDMWDKHWCRGATARVAEMAPRMNEVLKSARAKGVLIIHCPSDCMKFYDGTPQRKLAQGAPAASTLLPITGWRQLDPKREAALPIDDSDGGCNCEPQCHQAAPWTREIAALEIGPDDAITDNAEAFNLMRSRGITNVIVMGVHANMCVLGRPFSIRQMVAQRQNVVFMRDMTDTMYNSRQAPHVSHFSGTDLVVEHIERYWCPSVSSADFTGKEEFRFAADHRPHVAILMAEDEYDTARTISAFAAEHLQKVFQISLIYGNENNRNDLPGIEAVRSADVLVVSVRRRTLPREQMAILRNHVVQGKGVVGIRTASHAFVPLPGEAIAAGTEAWPEFDRDVLGGNYAGHYGNKGDKGDRTMVRAVEQARQHRILAGVSMDEFVVRDWLYKVSPLAPTATPLMLGRVEGSEVTEPVAWTNDAGKSRVFYTSLGHPDDFNRSEFVQLLENGIRWVVEEML